MIQNTSSSLPARMRRILALIRKETWQILRDPSSIIIGIFIPMLLLLLFGYGISFDIKNLPVAIVMDDRSAEARQILSGFELSRYFEIHPVKTMSEAENLVKNKTVKGIVRIPMNFARDVASGQAQVQFVVNGTDANTARIALGYAQGAINTALLRAQGEAKNQIASISIQNRLWFNEANDSTYFLIPGLVVVIMTLIGAFLTALVVAREWERGTFEALFVTPARSSEILLGKTVPYFILGMTGLTLCVLGGRFLFGVPIRGSISVLIIVSTLYLLVALSMGLVISSLTKSQFVASLVSLLVSFLPALLLSGFIFDVKSMPAFVQLITYILPARYFVAILQSLFLAGDIWTVILPNSAVLFLMAVLLMSIAIKATQKKLG